VVLAEVWVYTPYVVLILLAGLQALPQAPFEAARVDGASRLFILRKITIPLLLPTILVAAIFRLVFSLREFAVIWVITRGGPINATYMLSMYIYKNLFLYFNDNYSAALGIALLFVTFLVSFPLMMKMYTGIKEL
jgi:multiple sugar transport system permease protein